ncbi:MAG TPA: ATP-dependent zinc metalloprotease FtsH [Candidatus Binataceae bacterium]|nr:ATP-dependent zinc metalloprotease FtsH [Candidatus Binataceae bacterium]
MAKEPRPRAKDSGDGGKQTLRQPAPSGLNFFWILWLLIGAWMLWSTLTPRNSSPQIELPYTTFLAQVRADNVSKVLIADAQISGDFVKPMVVPAPKAKAEAKPEPSPASPTQNPESKPPTAAKSGGTQPPPPIAYPRFRTTFPATVGDPNLMPLLESHKIVVDVASTEHSWLIDMLIDWGPLLLVFALFWWLTARSTRGQSGLFGFGRLKLKRYGSDQPRVTFADVAGAEEAKAELQEEVDFLKHPERYHDMGARIPQGVLLVGPPGTGKTLLARAVAGEAEVPFFSINASEFVQMFVGVGASRVRDLFRQAKEAAPAIVFIDELDAVGRRRGAGVGTVNDEREQTLNQLLGELDGFDPRAEVIILAATNRPDVLDPALLRPGRFDREVVVGPPSRQGREGILRIHTRKLHLAADVDLFALSVATIGMSGADLANLCNEAALTATRHLRSAITMADFEEAIDKVRLGAAQPGLIDSAERRIVAYHESGHAVVAWLTPGADPVQKVTIVPHGQALGLTQQVPAAERHNLSRSYLMTRLAVMLGGRTAEELVFGEITTGAESDLVEATRITRRMITRWGMGKLGLAAYKTDEQQPFLGYELAQGREYSETTAARIDAEVQETLDQVHQQVRKLLSDARERLDKLVATLLQHETVSHEELEEILGPQVPTPLERVATSGSAPTVTAPSARLEPVSESKDAENSSPDGRDRHS